MADEIKPAEGSTRTDSTKTKLTYFRLRGKATQSEWAKMTNAEKERYFNSNVIADTKYWITHADGVRVAFFTPELVQQAAKLTTDAERESFFNENVIAIDDAANPTVELR